MYVTVPVGSVVVATCPPALYVMTVVLEVATPRVHPEVGPVVEEPSIGSYPVFTWEVTVSPDGRASPGIDAHPRHEIRQLVPARKPQ